MADSRGVAYHEAGHAVVGWALGMRFKYMSIKPTKKDTGRIQFSGNWLSRDRKVSENNISILFAGKIAQETFTGYDLQGFGCGRDFKYIEHWLALINPANPSFSEPNFPLLARLQARAERLVNKHW